MLPYSSFATAAALVGRSRGLELVLFGRGDDESDSSRDVDPGDRPCDFEKFQSIARTRFVTDDGARRVAV